jgi:hypothetical protein
MKKTFLVIFAVFSILSCDLLILGGEGPASVVSEPKGYIGDIRYSASKDQGRFSYTIYNTGETDIYNTNFNIVFSLDITPFRSTNKTYRTLVKTVNVSQVIYKGQQYSSEGNFMLSRINGDDNNGDGYVEVKIHTVNFYEDATNHTTTADIGINVKNISGHKIDECDLYFEIKLKELTGTPDYSFCYGTLRLTELLANTTISSGLLVNTYGKKLYDTDKLKSVKFTRFVDTKEYYECFTENVSVNSVQFKK